MSGIYFSASSSHVVTCARMSFTDQLSMTPGSINCESDKPAYDSSIVVHAFSSCFRSCCLFMIQVLPPSAALESSRFESRMRLDSFRLVPCGYCTSGHWRQQEPLLEQVHYYAMLITCKPESKHKRRRSILSHGATSLPKSRFPTGFSSSRSGGSKGRMYRMAKQYRVNAFVVINNPMIISLLRLGVNIGSFALLTVRGRKSGKPIETPIAIFDQKGTHYLIATYGLVNWVRNLRAAGGRAPLTRLPTTAKTHAL